MSEAPFHMVQFRLSIPGLIDLGKRRKLPLHDIDEGYLVHCAVKELFGERAPRPFGLADTGALCNGSSGGHAGSSRQISILGYSDHPADALRDEAAAVAEPAAYKICDWDSVQSKPMPTSWDEGSLFRFRVRACPVVRKSKAGAKHKEGAEIDAFLDRCLSLGRGVGVEREAVYLDWLRDQFARRAGAEIESCALRGFRLLRVSRRRHSTNNSRVFERPDALFEGRLRVVSSEGFSDTLRNGVGRHRGFGFGMLLLRPS